MDATVKTRQHDFLSSLRDTSWAVSLSAPVIYSLIIPFALLDLWVSLYQALCFRAYGIERVERGAFFKLDRAKLPYLNTVEKFTCLYCSYVNGVIGFVREVSARTEQYWCPIKHAEAPIEPHDRCADFSAYGAAGEFAARRKDLRAALRPDEEMRRVTQAVRPTRTTSKSA